LEVDWELKSEEVPALPLVVTLAPLAVASAVVLTAGALWAAAASGVESVVVGWGLTELMGEANIGPLQ
jgi:hypothetical protein